MKAQVAEQQQIAAAVNQVRSAAETFSTNKREEAELVLQQRQAELAIAKAQGDKAKEAQLQDQVDTAQKAVEDWGTGGKNRQAVDATLNGLGLALGGNSVEAVAAGAASPYVNTAIKHATEGEGYEWANLALHGIWGAVEAATQGANALGGASSAVTGEVAAKILTEKLFGETNPETLTEEQKRTVSQLSQMIAGAVSGGTELAQGGDAVSSVQNVNVGMGIAKNAVENNRVSAVKKVAATGIDELLALCAKNTTCQSMGILSFIGVTSGGMEDALDAISRQSVSDIQSLSPQQISYLIGMISARRGLLSPTDMAFLNKNITVEQRMALTEEEKALLGNIPGYSPPEPIGPSILDTPIVHNDDNGVLPTPINEPVGSVILDTPDKGQEINPSDIYLSKKIDSHNESTSSLRTNNKDSINKDTNSTVIVPRSKYPQAAAHIEEALAKGLPDILTIDREGAKARRKAALSGVSTKIGYDRDEYPPAMFKDGGEGASIKHIDPSDNRGAGKCIGVQCKELNNGDKVKIIIGD